MQESNDKTLSVDNMKEQKRLKNFQNNVRVYFDLRVCTTSEQSF